MKWISATQLASWAQHIDARNHLSSLIRDLIRASDPRGKYIRFPAGDQSGVRGFDGHIESNLEEHSFIPHGESIWELGVSGTLSKAERDYESKTSKTAEEVRLRSTLVLVSLVTVDSPRQEINAWIEARCAEKKWKEVTHIDGSQIEIWLNDHPAVAAYYARLVLKTSPASGALSTDEFWHQYTSRFTPPITEEVVLAGRDTQAQELLERLSQENTTTYKLGADTEDEVIAFAIASMRKAPENDRAVFEACTMVVESEDAARFLSQKKGMIFLTKGAAAESAGFLAAAGPTLASIFGVQSNRFPKLNRPSPTQMAKALTSMEYDLGKAYQIARNCSRSLTILSRLHASGKHPEPQWVKFAKVLTPAILAGGWDTKSDLDCAILCALSAKANYQQFEAEIVETRNIPDPPLDWSDTVRQVRSPIDALPYVGSFIGDIELERLKQAAITVFSAKDERENTDSKSGFFTRPPTYSKWLRDGLAITLLEIAAVPDHIGLPPKPSYQPYIDGIIEALPEWGKNHISLIRLGEQITLLAEAAPEVFLTALEKIIGGDPADILNIFAEREEFFTPESPHVRVLFALETLAWDPELLPRVSIILARLAAVDPGGKLRNRPINSLRSIFLVWAPNTYASLAQRMSAIDAISTAVPEIGWQLIKRILPSLHDTGEVTSEPRIRDVSPAPLEILTAQIRNDGFVQVVEHALDLAAGHATRLQSLLKRATNLGPHDRLRLIELIDQYFAGHPPTVDDQLWDELRKFIKHNEQYKEASWAISESELTKFREVLAGNEPKDILARSKWLFEQWVPDYANAEANGATRLDIKRASVLEEIKTNGGITQIVEFVLIVDAPVAIATALNQLQWPIDDFDLLISLSLRKKHLRDSFISVASSIAMMRFGNEWSARATALAISALNEGISAEAISNLFSRWDSEAKTWAAVTEAGEEIEAAYWGRTEVFPENGDTDAIRFAIEKFTSAGRPLVALFAMQGKLDRLEPAAICGLLSAGVKELNENPDRYSGILHYYLEETFQHLRNAPNANRHQVAACELSYIGVFRFSNETLIIHNLLAEDPNFFFELVANIFRSEDELHFEPTQQQKMLATASYDVLSTFHLLPGTHGDGIDEIKLDRWVTAVRELAAQRKLTDITDQQIGRVLAHAPQDPLDSGWPHAAARFVIERAASEHIETGIEVERFNMRGAHFKSPELGGAEERSFAKSYREWAPRAAASPRTSAMLHRIAQQWDLDAAREDMWAEQHKMKY